MKKIMTNDPFTEYAVLDAQIKELEIKKESLRSAIIAKMATEGLAKVETTVGKFTIAKLKRYEYPQYVIEAGEHYKALKAQSENTGDAIESEIESLKFTGLKL